MINGFVMGFLVSLDTCWVVEGVNDIVCTLFLVSWFLGFIGWTFIIQVVVFLFLHWLMNKCRS